MLGKRTMFKKFRKWFEPCFNDPLRLKEERFISLLMEMFGTTDYNHEEGIEVLKKLGFEERRNIKGTFYIRPTLYFYMEANEKRISVYKYFDFK